MISLKHSIKKVLEKFGYGVYKIHKGNSGAGPYEAIKPSATYAPWIQDEMFLQVYDTVRNNTLVDKYRCFELWQLVGQAIKLNEGALIEIGVWNGGTAGIICKRAQLCGFDKKVYLCDTFCGVVKAGEKDHIYKGGEHADCSQQTVEELLSAQIKVSNFKILKGIFPEQTSHMITDETFGFCHIDVDVYQSAKDIISWIWPKIEVGGIVVYDDYGFQGCDGISKFVDEQFDERDRLVIHNLNGHAIVIKLRS